MGHFGHLPVDCVTLLQMLADRLLWIASCFGYRSRTLSWSSLERLHNGTTNSTTRSGRKRTYPWDDTLLSPTVFPTNLAFSASEWVLMGKAYSALSSPRKWSLPLSTLRRKSCQSDAFFGHPISPFQVALRVSSFVIIINVRCYVCLICTKETESQ